jgi:hypothetical protein
LKLSLVTVPVRVYTAISTADGGPVALCFFSRTALWGDVMIAVLLSLAAAVCYPGVRKDVLRTLGYETQASQLGCSSEGAGRVSGSIRSHWRRVSVRLR